MIEEAPKKDVKKGAKPEPVKEEEEKKEEVEPEKEYKKALDVIYFLIDFPLAQVRDNQIDVRLSPYSQPSSALFRRR